MRRALALVLVLQAVVSVTQLRNTAFQDEGLYLYAGRQIIRHWTGGPAPLDNYAFYFSGYPYIYPVIGGLLDRLGGLELARSFSLACMLGVTTIVYSITKKLFGVPAAVFAAAIYAVTGVVLFLSRLATFDALCLFLIASATGLAVSAGINRRPWATVGIGPVLVLAILAKYAALLFVPPVFVILAWLAFTSFGLRQAIVRLFLALSALALSLAIAYEVVDSAAFHAISGSTTNRETELKAQRLDLLTHILQMSGVQFGIALVGLFLLLRHRRFRLLALMLFATSWLAPLYHLYMREPISLDKHIGYGLFFAAPLAGYALAWLSGYERAPLASSRGYWLAGIAVVLAVFVLGLPQSETLFSNWANTSQLGEALRTQLRDGTGRILAEDIEVARYDMRRFTQEWQWGSFYYPYYVDASKKQLLGDAALAAALHDRFYDVVELSFNYFPAEAYTLANRMITSTNYDFIGRVPFENSYGKGHFYLFRSSLAPGGGTFKSLAQLRMNVWP